MEHSTAIRLLKSGVAKTSTPQIWADFGAGTGVFTTALAEMLPMHSIIYAVDKNENAVDSIRLHAPNTTLKKIHADFSSTLAIPKPDGLLMANSLHFMKEKVAFISHLHDYLKSDGRIIFVELFILKRIYRIGSRRFQRMKRDSKK